MRLQVRSPGWVFPAAALVLAAGLHGQEPTKTPAPPPPVPPIVALKWSGTPVDPRAERGRYVVLLFFQTAANDLRGGRGFGGRGGLGTSHNDAASELRDLVAQVETAATFGAVPVAVARDIVPTSFASVVNAKRITFSCALDAAEVTTSLYGINKDKDNVVVVLGPDGRQLARGGANEIKSAMAAIGKRAPASQPVSPAVAAAEALIAKGQLGAALAAVRRLPDKDPAVAEYRARTLATLEAGKTAQYQAMLRSIEAGAPVDAFTTGQAFLKTYPGEPEAKDVSAALAKLRDDPALKQMSVAESAFFAAAHLLMSQTPTDREKGQQMMSAVANQYAQTPFGHYAKAALGMAGPPPAP